MAEVVRKTEERKRILEVVIMLLISLVLVVLSRLEKVLFQLSENLSANREFFNSVVYFGLINFNVVLILVLSFLIFRNVIKLVIERRRGVIGSKLRTKLVVSLVFFAVAPTALLFYVSSRFLTESFDTWFSSRVESTIVKTKEAGALVYNREGRRLESLARIALQRIKIERGAAFVEEELPTLNSEGLRGFDREYSINTVKLFDASGRLVWSSEGLSAELLAKESGNDFVMSTIERFSTSPGFTARNFAQVEEGRDVVKGAAPFIDPVSGKVLGIVVTEERFETQIVRSVEAILREFSDLRPGAQLIKLSYTILLVVMVIIIVFSATWLGFYVARGIIGPVQSLAEATREVAMGNYEINLSVPSDDETGRLVRSFNFMIDELRSNRNKVKTFTEELEHKNIELDSRRKYMEIVLKNISAGVLSLDDKGDITSINDAARGLLDIEPHIKPGTAMQVALPKDIQKEFWQPIEDGLAKASTFSGQLVIAGSSGDKTLVVDATHISDEDAKDLGCVVVFADASEQIRAQRVAAWREVARRIAHEIKNPITPIKLSAQRLLRRFGKQFSGQDREVFGVCIETIVAEVDNLRDLVNEFSKFSRLPTIKPKRQNLNDLIIEVHGLYSMSYPEIVFNIDGLTEGLPYVDIDKEQMSRVLSNLVVNAEASIRGAGVAGGQITFKTSFQAHLAVVRLEVIDNGGGIPDSIRSKVLEPYFSTKDEGTGLGLAIVNQIISDHGGYLRIGDSVNQVGATIVIDLPMPERMDG